MSTITTAEGQASDAETQQTQQHNVDSLCDLLNKAEDLFTKVRHPREAVCDSAFLVQITKRGQEQVGNF